MNGNGIWKWIAGLLAALILGMAVRALQEPKDTVTQKEMSMQISLLQTKLDALSNQVAALQQTVNEVARKVGVTVVAPKQ